MLKRQIGAIHVYDVLPAAVRLLELRRKAALLPFFAAFEGRVLCFEDVPRPKPFPDLYLAAAQACGPSSATNLVA